MEVDELKKKNMIEIVFLQNIDCSSNLYCTKPVLCRCENYISAGNLDLRKIMISWAGILSKVVQIVINNHDDYIVDL